VLGPWLTTADEIADPNALDLELAVNGEQRQRSNTKYLIFDVQRLIEYASAMYTLNPGDVIMTGTPAGVGPVHPGDIIDARIEGLGNLSVTVTG
jgi:2-keto-4-pentenoate hydratase/2-oxohepta-3-ene-1,7-dioic acid hydratase in catechol pathway